MRNVAYDQEQDEQVPCSPSQQFEKAYEDILV